MTILGLSAALFVIFAAGIGTTLVLSRGQRSLHLAEICALSWFFGTGVISLLLWSGGLFFSGALLQSFVTLVAVTLGTVGVCIARKERAQVSVPFPDSAIEWILTTVIALQFAFILYLSFSHGLGWDGLLNFEIKARYSFQNGGVLPVAYFNDISRNFTHQSYPPWIPLNELWLYLWIGETNQFWLKMLFPPFYFAGTMLLGTIATRLTARRWIGLLIVALLFFVPSLTTKPGGVQVGYADIPLSILYLGAIGYLLCAAESNETTYWRLSAACLALLPWAKREGLFLWLIAALCAIIVIWQKRWSPRRLLWLLPGMVIMVAWKVFYSLLGKSEAFEYMPMTLTNLINNSPRIGPIVGSLGAMMIDTTEWSILWPMTAVTFAWLFWRWRDRNVPLLFLAVVGPIFLYSPLYLFSGWPDWFAHIQQSLPRLLLHVVPVIWLAIALALQPPEPRQEALGAEL